jgi:phosphomannomutase
MYVKGLDVDKFIFDVDGTITPSRCEIDNDFAVFFLDFCANNDVYLVTGSDKEKTLEQVGEEIYSLCKRVYNCSGSDVWEGEKNVKRNKWVVSSIQRAFLVGRLGRSKFPLRTGKHIEERPGMVNFSIVGRNATSSERKLYVEWDTKENERIQIASAFNNKFPNLLATVGGETGIDIAPKGADKSQIIDDFKGNTTHFFGDMMEVGGNDYSLAQVVSKCYPVEDWKQTKKYLKELIKNKVARK